MDETRKVFEQHTGFDPIQARLLLEKPMSPDWIEKRNQGGKELSYVGGHVVIRLLNLAFNQRWSFEILDTKILGEPGVKGTIVSVHGRMTVPGLGVREQYGNQAFSGNMMDEHTIKGATTDAMKKCANMFGVALELFGDVEGLVGANIDDIIPMSSVKKEKENPSTQIAEKPINKEPETSSTPTATPTATPEPEPEVEQSAPLERKEESPTPVSSQWDAKDLADLKANRAKIAELAGAETEEEKKDNNYLNPFIQEFLENPDVDVHAISPSNVRDFNVFLSKKIEGFSSSYE